MCVRVPVTGVFTTICKLVYLNILKLLISSETTFIKRPFQIRLFTSSNDFVIHNSYIGKSDFDICNVCHKSLSKSEPRFPKIFLKTFDVGPWPSLLIETDVDMTPFKRPTFAERIVMSLLMHTKYLNVEYHVSGEKYTPQG